MNEQLLQRLRAAAFPGLPKGVEHVGWGAGLVCLVI